MEKKSNKLILIILTVVICIVLLAVMLVVLLLGTDIPALAGAKAQVSRFLGFSTAQTVTEPEETEPEPTEPLKSYTVDDEKAREMAEATVATVGEDTLTNSELQIYYQMYYATYATYFQYYYGLDPSIPLDEQVYDTESNTTWQEFVLGNAIMMWHQYSAVEQAARAEGYTLDAEAQEYADTIDETFATMLAQSDYATLAEMLEKEMGVGITEETYRNYFLTNHYVTEYMADLEASYTPTQEELDEFYQKNASYYTYYGILQDDGDVVDVRHILIQPEGGTTDETTGTTTYSEEEWEACRQKAQALLDGWKSGEATEESFGELAKENSADNADEGGLYQQVTKGYMVESFNDWIFDDSRKKGDTGLVETKFGYHIMYFVKREQVEPLWIEEVKPDWVTERINTFIQEVTETYPITTNYDAIGISQLQNG